MFRLLWAQALDEAMTAMVIETDGEFLGGVAYLRRMEHHYPEIDPIFSITGDVYHSSKPGGGKTELYFQWVWNRVVSSMEEFRDQEGWKRGPVTPAIEPPTIDHE